MLSDRAIHRTAPVLRAATFAAAIARPRVLDGRPEWLGLVLREPLTPIIRPHGHARGTTTLRWDIRVSVPGELRTLIHRRDTAPSPAWLARVSELGPRSPEGSRPPSTRLMALVQRAAAIPMADRPAEPTGHAPGAGTAPARRTPAAPLRPGPGAVPLVHRQAGAELSAGSGPPGPAVTAPPPPLAARWGDRAEPAGPASAVALTVQDLPVMVDRVVRELDRRVVAARERRGWSG